MNNPAVLWPIMSAVFMAGTAFGMLTSRFLPRKEWEIVCKKNHEAEDEKRREIWAALDQIKEWIVSGKVIVRVELKPE
jgi:hypothetical protein